MPVGRVVVPIVVDGVEERVSLDFGRSAGEVVDVVALEGDEVLGTVEEQSPVCVAVAISGVCYKMCVSVELARRMRRSPKHQLLKLLTASAVKVVVTYGDARVC